MTVVFPAVVRSFNFQTPCMDLDCAMAPTHRINPSTTEIVARLIVLFLLKFLGEAHELYFIAQAESNRRGTTSIA